MRFILPLLVALAAPAAAQEVEIASFAPERRSLAPGDSAASAVVVRNAGRVARRVWVGYSVQGPGGEWFDVPAREMALAARGQARARLAWPVPPGAGGEYRVVMAVWSAPPGTAGARRLASADREDAFRVAGGAVAWQAARHTLGRGALLPGGVLRRGEGFRLTLPRGTCDGAEVRTSARFQYGEYTARMRTPVAPGSLSAFFLYQDVRGGNDEIDIEILNDGSRRILLTTWVAGRKAQEATLRLPFDPSAAHHDYTIRRDERSVSFLADGVVLRRWTSGVPGSAMRVVANAWWPTWLSCAPPGADQALDIEWIRLVS